MSKASILFENGEILYADANLDNKTIVGELVFNTSMTGYQEILTDPSYAAQIVVMTYPLVGNYGVFEKFNESEKIQVSAFIIKENSETEIIGAKNLSEYLAENGILCLSNVDTRKITKFIRSNGCINCLITTDTITEEHKKMLSEYIFPKDIVKKVSCSDIKKYSALQSKVADIAVIDYGVKKSIINSLCKAGADLTVFPFDFKAETILNGKFDAILLSNGPGDPKDVDITEIKKLFGKIPMFGICFGHQLLALALGADTYKLKFGHRGANHPVLNLLNGKVIISSQNHGYAVDEKSLPNNIQLTYKNINDDTVEGFLCEDFKINCIQFHPEAGPGPYDSVITISDWVKSVSKESANA